MCCDYGSEDSVPYPLRVLSSFHEAGVRLGIAI